MTSLKANERFCLGCSFFGVAGPQGVRPIEVRAKAVAISRRTATQQRLSSGPSESSRGVYVPVPSSEWPLRPPSKVPYETNRLCRDRAATASTRSVPVKPKNRGRRPPQLSGAQ